LAAITDRPDRFIGMHFMNPVPVMKLVEIIEGFKTDKAVTEEEGTALLQAMLVSFEKYVDSYCRDDINQNQFDALVSFAYNLGPANLKSSTLLKKVNANPNDETIALEFMKWVKAGGKTLKGLVRRREAESQLYFKK
jgi:lysozyme